MSDPRRVSRPGVTVIWTVQEGQATLVEDIADSLVGVIGQIDDLQASVYLENNLADGDWGDC